MKLIRLLLIVAFVLPSISFAGPKPDPDETTYQDVPLASLATTPQQTEEGPTEKTKLLSDANALLADWDEDDDDCCVCQNLNARQRTVCFVSTIAVGSSFFMGFFFMYLAFASH